MIIVMSSGATAQQVQDVLERVEAVQARALVSRGAGRIVVGVVGGADRVDRFGITGLPGVVSAMPVAAPYKLVSREHHPRRSTVLVAGVPIGPGPVTLIAGPCAVESFEQTLAAARMAKGAGATVLRGGAFKPRTSPYAFQGLGLAGLRILAEVSAEVGLPVVTEVVDSADVDVVADHVDMLQIGSRNMANFALLQAVGGAGKPVLLKRGMTATIDEWLLAAEYIAAHGTLDIVLCERGIRTYETATRNTLDVSAVPIAQRLSHLPVVVDPSHSGGSRDLVLPLTRAGIAAGADGIMVDVHPNPAAALCDGPQALASEPELRALREALRLLPPAIGRAGAHLDHDGEVDSLPNGATSDASQFAP